jgi:hypothetical protein
MGEIELCRLGDLPSSKNNDLRHLLPDPAADQALMWGTPIDCHAQQAHVSRGHAAPRSAGNANESE